MDSAELLAFLGGCFERLIYGDSLVFGLFFVGLVSGASHCAVMCGPFVVAQSGDVQKISQAALLPYHLGRITTYVALAALLASVLNLAFLFLPIRSFIIAPLLGTAGLVFIVSAIPAAARIFPFLLSTRFALPYKLVQGQIERLSLSPTILRRYVLGVMLGFMPCGMIVGALMAASTAPSTLQAAAAMAAFGLGTMPALLAVGFGAFKMKNAFPKAMTKARPAVMAGAGLWLFVMAGMILSQEF